MECPICYDQLKDKLLLSNCGHSFCTRCVYNWIIKNPSCPLCRASVSATEEYDANKYDLGYIKKVKHVYNLSVPDISPEERKLFVEYLSRKYINIYLSQPQWKKLKAYILFDDNIYQIFRKTKLETKISYSYTFSCTSQFEHIYYKIKYT